MRLLDYLEPECVAVDLSAADKRSALRLVVDVAAGTGLVGDPDQLMQLLLNREGIVSTGIGNGLAIPHADIPNMSAPKLALGLFPKGVDFESLDEEPVFVIFLLLGTPRTPGLHMKILARIARLSKDPRFFTTLRKATNPAEAFELLESVEVGR